MENNTPTSELLARAKQDLMLNMRQRGLGAILWDNATADFHYIPELTVAGKDGKSETVRAMGLYIFNDSLYIVEEDKSKVHISSFYNHDTEVKPTVVTLPPEIAEHDFGNPQKRPGFTQAGSLEEWVVIADCYFEALAEKE